MRNLSRLLILLSTAVSVAVAQQSPQRDAAAIQILQDSFAQLGGGQKAAIRDFRIEGTVASAAAPDKPTGTFVAKSRGDDFSFELTRNGETTSYKVLKGRGSFRAQGKTTALQPFNTSGLGLDVFPILSRWTEFLRQETKVDAPVTVQYAGSPHVLIHIASEPREKDESTANNHSEFDLIVDPATRLLAAIRFKGSFGPYSGDRLEVENQFSNYRTVSGLPMPTRITRVLNGQPMLVLSVTSVRFNSGLADSDFVN